VLSGADKVIIDQLPGSAGVTPFLPLAGGAAQGGARK